MKVTIKKLYRLLPLLALLSCNKVSLPENHIGSAANTCLEQPGTLKENPPTVALNAEFTQLSGSLKNGENVNYRFEGKQGQTLTLNQPDNSICVVIYSWEQEPLDLDTPILPVDGEYVVQLSTLKETQSFDIGIGLDVPQALQPSQPAPTQGSNAKTLPSPTTSADLSEEDAVKIVQTWLDAKSRVFGPPFSLEAVKEIIDSNGPLYKRLAGPESPIRWLKKSNHYYTYKTSKINRVIAYESVSNNRFSLKVEILEDLSLHKPRGIDRSISGRSVEAFEYVFSQEGNVWKIYSSGSV